MPGLEEAANIVADGVTLGLEEYPTTIRRVESTQVSQIIKISGIIVASSQVRAKATKLTLQYQIRILWLRFASPMWSSSNWPNATLSDWSLCDKCICVDYQTLKLQKNSQDISHGEMPRHLPLYVDRYLTDKGPPNWHPKAEFCLCYCGFLEDEEKSFHAFSQMIGWEEGFRDPKL
ncbi:unnamed protein product, partial [Mesorhabditis belari]|uniref:MCM OB domain-containing protein n=1 Tax=Mesorhabditis belari TaxID=2138241 RepID=A0AAF3EFZ8_9BILA